MYNIKWFNVAVSEKKYKVCIESPEVYNYATVPDHSFVTRDILKGMTQNPR